MRASYNIGVVLYGWAIRLAALFNAKARKWVQGRKGWQGKLENALSEKEEWIWMHCASLGEFEQGRNLLESLREQYPHYGILLTFFSPSGYEVRKNYAHADYVCYLPLDTPANARKWIDKIPLKLAVFVKYELWLNYLQTLREKEVPTILISARVNEKSAFLRSSLKHEYRKAFAGFDQIFVQDQLTLKLLQNFTKKDNLVRSGDTRYDRVLSNRQESEPIKGIQDFVGERLVIMGGSTWPMGEKLLLSAFDELKKSYSVCLILAPHEIHPEKIEQQITLRPGDGIRFSKIHEADENSAVLWIDNIGMLARLYAQADIAYVGGGWGSGLHNILEPAVFGCPVLFGPKTEKFPEAADMIAAGGAFQIHSLESLRDCLAKLLESPELRETIQRTNKTFISQQAGATTTILNWCESHSVLNKP